ncbi:MAG: alpha/beta hydrolase [Candidatus Brocadiia bacterium]
MPEKPANFISCSERLYGILGLPDTDPVGGVVLLHGWSGCRMGPHRILVETARNLNLRGMATLRFDFSGRGESEGDPFQTDVDRMLKDTTAAIDYLQNTFDASLPIALLGMCSGGNVALSAASMDGRISAVACWSTYPFQIQRQRRQDVKRTGHFLKTYIKKALRRETWTKLVKGRINFGMIFDVLFGHYRKDSDQHERNPQEFQQEEKIVEALANYPGNLLFLFGGADPEAKDARKLFGEFLADKKPAAEFHVVKRSNHNFYSLPWKKEALTHTAHWFAKILG